MKIISLPPAARKVKKKDIKIEKNVEESKKRAVQKYRQIQYLEFSNLLSYYKEESKMFPQWVNQTTFYTYIFKQFEHHYAHQLPFDIHEYIVEGNNKIAVQEYRFSSGSWLMISRATVSPPIPESNTPIGAFLSLKSFICQIYKFLN